jgi:ribonucleotide reductase alpha subunit
VKWKVGTTLLSFSLSDEFVEQYANKQAPFGFPDAAGNRLGELTFIRSYSRVKEDGTKERWHEVCRRVVEGMYSIQKDWALKNKLPWNSNKAAASAKEAYDRLFNLKWTPPGRGLWTMGSPIVHERGLAAALYNCFSGDTKIITSMGVMRLDELVGEKIEVWTGSEWVGATGHEFGVQQVNRVTFKPHSDRSNHRIDVTVTPNHRWILKDGTETTGLSIGDVVVAAPVKPSNMDYDGIRHGIIFGDGTRQAFVRSDGMKRFGIRFCGERADEMRGYFDNITQPPSANGDYYGQLLSMDELKEFPVGKSAEYISGFIYGWMLADGNAITHTGFKLDSQHPEAYQWLCENAAYGGFVVVGHGINGGPTNFGERKNPLHRITLRNLKEFVVVAIDDMDKQPVYCVTVPEQGKFVLASGLLTGNCSFVSTGDIDRYNPGYVFGWIMDALMLGVGVGFDTRGSEKGIQVRVPDKERITYVIPDTREGWVQSAVLLINSYLRNTSPVDFDYSLIRGYGEPIKGFGGTSSGPAPLQKLHGQLRKIFEQRAGETLDSRLIVDVVNLIGMCVVSGNVRRSATIALGSADDEEFSALKDYGRFPERVEWGWMSNNTLVIEDDFDYDSIVDLIANNGEPGLLWINTMREYGRTGDLPDNKDWRVQGTNPCAEISLESFELCNLVEIHLDRAESVDDFLRTIKFAYLFAKTVTLLPTHWSETNAVIQRNRRIGTSLTGIAGFTDAHGLRTFREWANAGYQEVAHYDTVYSEWLGVRESIRTTTVKPSGSVSLLSGSTPGSHWPPAGNYYMRAIRFSDSDNMLHLFRAAGYKLEPDVYSDNTTVVYFPMHVPFHRSERDVSIYEKVHLAATAQEVWADNSVSVTISFDPKRERDDVPRVLKMYEGKLKTASFLPMGDAVYAQQPYTSITKEEYEDWAMRLFNIDWSAIYDGVDNLDAIGDKYCTTDTCLM